MTPRDPYKNIEQLTLQQLEVNPKQYVWTMRYFLSVWQGCENAFSSFGCLFNLLETMLWVRLRCSRVCRINHQKCVTFLPPNLSYLALKIAHYSFIALKDDCSFLFCLFPLLGRQASPLQNENIFLFYFLVECLLSAQTSVHTSQVSCCWEWMQSLRHKYKCK